MAYTDTLRAVLNEFDVFLGGKNALREAINSLGGLIPQYADILDQEGIPYPITDERLDTYHKYIEVMDAQLSVEVLTSTIPYYGGNVDVVLRRRGVNEFRESSTNPTGGSWTKREDDLWQRTYSIGRNEANRSNKRTITFGYDGKDLFGKALNASASIQQSAMLSLVASLNGTPAAVDAMTRVTSVGYTRNDATLADFRKYGPVPMDVNKVVKSDWMESVDVREERITVTMKRNPSNLARIGSAQVTYSGYNAIERTLSIPVTQNAFDGFVFDFRGGNELTAIGVSLDGDPWEDEAWYGSLPLQDGVAMLPKTHPAHSIIANVADHAREEGWVIRIYVVNDGELIYYDPTTEEIESLAYSEYNRFRFE